MSVASGFLVSAAEISPLPRFAEGRGPFLRVQLVAEGLVSWVHPGKIKVDLESDPLQGACAK